MDFKNPDLIAAAKGLAPGLLRLGGSPIDSIQFDFDGKCVIGGKQPSPHFHCSQVQQYVYGCLTRSRIQDILQFGKTTGLSISLGLNACWNRKGRTEPIDFSNIEHLLQYIAGLDDQTLSPLIAFEFGNELLNNAKKPDIDPEVYAHDMNALSVLIHKVWTSHKHSRIPVLIGPASQPVQIVPFMLALNPGNPALVTEFHSLF